MKRLPTIAVLIQVSWTTSCTHREFYGKAKTSDPVKQSAEAVSCRKQGYSWYWAEDSQCRKKTFLQYCLDKRAPAGIIRTINFIRNELEQADCSDAYDSLNKQPGIYLGGYDLTDLHPLYGLTNLKFLRLEKNRLQDLSPLTSLKNLVVLRLDENLLSNISPLSTLTKLVVLRLDKNRIRNIEPVAGLTKLARINLNENKITDISPLSGLADLKKIGLRKNLVNDASPLSVLSSLSYLDLRENPLSIDKHKKSEANCPTTPPSPEPLVRFCKLKGRETPSVRSGGILKGRRE